MTRPATRRPAFTLVELMVATALVVLILTILAVAFGTATESLSKMRQIGTLAERLRTTEQILRADLSAQHFEANGSSVPPQLSDIRFDKLINPLIIPPESKPPIGYFRIEQGDGSINYEGRDNANAISTSAANHSLEFTVRREGRTPDDLFVVDVGGPLVAPGLDTSVSDVPLSSNQRAYRWAVVKWMLGTPRTVDSVTTHTLYRCVRVLTPQEVKITDPALADLFATRTTMAGTFTQTVGGINNPSQRPLISPYLFGTAHYGDDIVLTNVLSFEVKPAWDPPTGTPPGQRPGPRRSLPDTLPGKPVATKDGGGTRIENSEHPHDILPNVTENPSLAGQSVFDTWGAITAPGKSWNTPGTDYSIPLRIRVTAVQVKLRVYDPKNFQTRQVTFIVPQ